MPEASNTPEVIQKRYEYAIEYTQLKVEKKNWFLLTKWVFRYGPEEVGVERPKGSELRKQ